MNEINPILIWLNTFSATFEISHQMGNSSNYLVESTIISSLIVGLEKQVLIKLNTISVRRLGLVDLLK